MINNLNLQEMLNEATKVGFHFVKCLIWDKQSKICGTYYMNQFEYICLFRKGGDRPINNCGTSDILSIPIKKLKDENGNNLHDTEKPIELMKILELLNRKDEYLNICKNTEIQIKYEGYIDKARKEAEKMLKMDNIKLRADLDYKNIDNLALEARQKLDQIKPLSLGQASRISGINPSDIQVLAVYLRQHNLG